MKIDVLQGLPVECPPEVAILRFNSETEKKVFLWLIFSKRFATVFGSVKDLFTKTGKFPPNEG